MSNVAHSMHSNYNKQDREGSVAGGVRLGNWQEEIELEKTTGFSRAPLPKTPGYYNNHMRTIAHTDCADPSSFQSTAHAAMNQASLTKSRSVGPLEARRKKKFMDQAIAEAEQAAAEKLEIKNKIEYESINNATYSLNNSSISRLSNPSKSNKLFGGEVTKASLEAQDVANLPPGDYSKVSRV